ncbi:MAG: sensor histidine kinase [Candidatus Binatia bacterium]
MGDESTAHLVQRVRIGLSLALASNAAFALADFQIGPPQLVALTWIKLSQIAVIGAAFGVLRVVHTRAALLTVTLSMLAVIYGASAVSGALTGDIASTPILGGGITMLLATLLPWGAFAQAAAAGLTALAILANIYLVTGSFELAASYPAVAVLFVLSASVYVAHTFAHYRVALATEEQARAGAEVALSASEAEFRGIFESLVDVYFRLDLDGTVRRISPSVARYGPEAATLVARPLHALLADPAAEGEWMRQALQEGSVHDVELALRAADGAVVPVSLSARLLRDASGRPVGYEGLLHDIRERRQADQEIVALNHNLARRAAELERANRELESFSYSVSHDLRAPLRAIDSFSAILISDYTAQLDDEGRMLLSRVRINAQRMGELIDDLLTLARTMRADLRRTRIDLSAMAWAIAAELKLRHPDRAVRLSIADGVVGDGDPVLLRSVLENLLGNAWKFSAPRSDARIEFGAGPVAGGQAYWVRDNGVGFEMAYAAKLFHPFQRLHGPAEFEGTGIGLATVERIIHRHNGRVWAEGAPDRGATVYFTLG